MTREVAVRILAAAGTLVAAGCRDATTPTDPGARARAALQAAQAIEISVLARAVPGFGGFYLDDGTPTVYLTDVGQRAAAEAALARYGFARSAIRVLPADYAYPELERWFRRLSPETLAVPGAVLADLDESRNRILVGVENTAAAAAVRGIAARLGVPEGALVVREMEPIRFAVTLRDQVRPTVGGLQIHFFIFLCTLGFNAVDSGEGSFITNSHCTERQGGVEGTQYFQPLSSVPGSFIGTEVEDPQYLRGGECPRGRKCRRSDASRAAYAGGVNVELGGIAKTAGPNDSSIEITGTFDITGEDLRDHFTVGEVVNKIGRTTGWTQGPVRLTCVDTNVFGSNITQLCQTIVAAGVGAGDSGSNVFTQTGARHVTLSGILWGGGTLNGETVFVFSPLKNIEDELGPLTTF